LEIEKIDGLCRESGNGKDLPISHYLIEVKRNDAGVSVSFMIGDQSFLSMAQLLTFYRDHYLESTYLLRPASRQYVKVVAKFDYTAQVKTLISFYLESNYLFYKGLSMSIALIE